MGISLSGQALADWNRCGPSRGRDGRRHVTYTRSATNVFSLAWTSGDFAVVCTGFDWDVHTQTYTPGKGLRVEHKLIPARSPSVEGRGRSRSSQHAQGHLALETSSMGPRSLTPQGLSPRPPSQTRALSPASRLQDGQGVSGSFTISPSIYSFVVQARADIPAGTVNHRAGVILTTSKGETLKIALWDPALRYLRKNGPRKPKKGPAKLTLSVPRQVGMTATGQAPFHVLGWEIYSPQGKAQQHKIEEIGFDNDYKVYSQKVNKPPKQALEELAPLSPMRYVCKNGKPDDIPLKLLGSSSPLAQVTGQFTLTSTQTGTQTARRIGIKIPLLRELATKTGLLSDDQIKCSLATDTPGQSASAYMLIWRQATSTYVLRMSANGQQDGLPYYVHTGSSPERYLTSAL